MMKFCSPMDSFLTTVRFRTIILMVRKHTVFALGTLRKRKISATFRHPKPYRK